MQEEKRLKSRGRKPVFTIKELDLKNKDEVMKAAEVFFKAHAGDPRFVSPQYDAFNEKNSAVPWTPETAEHEVNSWHDHVKDDLGKAFVAKDENGNTVGVAVGHLLNSGQERFLQVPGAEAIRRPVYWGSEMAVHPDFQRKGVSKLLSEARLATAKKFGCKTIATRVHVENKPILAKSKKDGFVFTTQDRGNLYILIYKKI